MQCSRPWDNTSRVSAHCIKTVVLKGSVLLYNQICCVSLQSLCKRVVANRMCLKVCLSEKIIAVSILGRASSAPTTGTRRKEEKNIRDSKSSNSYSSRTNTDQVDQVTTILVKVGSL